MDHSPNICPCTKATPREQTKNTRTSKKHKSKQKQTKNKTNKNPHPRNGQVALYELAQRQIAPPFATSWDPFLDERLFHLTSKLMPPSKALKESGFPSGKLPSVKSTSSADLGFVFRIGQGGSSTMSHLQSAGGWTCASFVLKTHWRSAQCLPGAHTQRAARLCHIPEPTVRSADDKRAVDF